MSENENKERIRRMWQQVRTRGPVALADHIAEDYVRRDAEREYTREEFIEILAQRYEAFPDLVSETVDVLAEGDRVVYRWESTGTHRGTYLGIPPTHRSVRAEGVTISRFDNGKIIEEWASWNKNSVLHSLGILPLLNSESK